MNGMATSNMALIENIVSDCKFSRTQICADIHPVIYIDTEQRRARVWITVQQTLENVPQTLRIFRIKKTCSSVCMVICRFTSSRFWQWK